VGQGHVCYEQVECFYAMAKFVDAGNELLGRDCRHQPDGIRIVLAHFTTTDNISECSVCTVASVSVPQG